MGIVFWKDSLDVWFESNLGNFEGETTAKMTIQPFTEGYPIIQIVYHV